MKWSVLLLVGAIAGWLLWPVAGHISFGNCSNASGNCVVQVDPYPRVLSSSFNDKYNKMVMCKVSGQPYYCMSEEVAIPLSIFVGASVALIAAALIDRSHK